MNITPFVAQQVFIMLMLIALGYVLFKINLITKKGTKDMSNLLLNIVVPCVLIRAYQIDFTPDLAREIAIAFMLGVFLHALYIIVSHIVFFKIKDKEKRKVCIFGSIYSNCGFMGIPLLGATLGEKGIILGSGYLAIFNIAMWLHGLWLYGGSLKVLSIKSIVKNPGVIGTLAALILFFLRIKIPAPINSGLSHVAGLNTPLGMILLGTYLARTNILGALKEKKLYIVTAMRLIILPLISLFMMKFFGVSPFMGMVMMLSASCSTAAVCAIFAERFNMDTGFPSQIVSVSTILSLASLPIIAYITEMVL